MNRIFLSFLIILVCTFTFSISSQSQGVAINNDGSVADVTSMLDIKSTTSGILVPRMTSVQRLAIISPADGLLVYDLTTDSFWYYDLDATSWAELSGSTGGTCVSLEESYNCGGNGAGREITVDHGSLNFNTTSSATNSDVITISTSKGTSASPGSGISITNTSHGGALYGEITNNANQYSAIQGVVGSSNNNSSTTSFPSGISGYYDGSGIGVGVWGESQGNGASAGAGIYGLASNNNFGGYFESNSSAGINCKTNNSSTQAIQVVSSGASYTNPSALFRGSVQFDISTTAACPTLLFNNLAGEPTISPQANQYGYLGTGSYAWYYLYYFNAVNASRRELKREITPIDSDIGNFLLAEIDHLKPSFYKYNIETDEFNPDNPSKFRPNMHLGLIVDESPDYLQDNAFSGIDIYALATLSIAGVQEIHKKVKKLEETIHDFGIIKTDKKEVYINLNDDFSNRLSISDIPVITATPTSNKVQVFIKNQDKNGFTIELSSLPEEEIIVNWIAIAKVTVEKEQNYNSNIAPELMQQLIISEETKNMMRNISKNQKHETLELLNSEIKPNSKRNKTAK